MAAIPSDLTYLQAENWSSLCSKANSLSAAGMDDLMVDVSHDLLLIACVAAGEAIYILDS